VNAAPRGIDRVREALDSHDGERIDLLVGTPCFPPPPELLDALARAAAAPHFDYAPNQGTPGLRQAIARLHAREGEDVDAAQVFVSHGAKVAALVVLGTLLQPGDEVVLPTPCYPAYRKLPRLFGATVRTVEREGPPFAWDVERIQEAIHDRTRAVLVTSPCNPTGATLDPEALRALVDLCRGAGIRLLLDEAYTAFRFDPSTMGSCHVVDPKSEVTIRLRSFSKTYGLCGWRMGYVLAEPQLIERLTWFQASHVNPPNTLIQNALESAIDVPASYHAVALESVRSRLAAIVSALGATPLSMEMPQGGFYALIDLRDAMHSTGHASATEFCRSLAAREGVAFWPGEDYGAPGWARICGAALETPDFADELSARVRRFLS
jgi:aspartate/methionine/tyrosine aminotransferase